MTLTFQNEYLKSSLNKMLAEENLHIRVAYKTRKLKSLIAGAGKSQKAPNDEDRVGAVYQLECKLATESRLITSEKLDGR